MKSHNDLDHAEQGLTRQELQTLQEADAVYNDKGFEYWSPMDGMTAYKRFPDLEALDAIAKKLIQP